MADQADGQSTDDLGVHLICDNYATHKTPAVAKWLGAHPRFHMHHTPTYASWLNQVERWFTKSTDKTAPAPTVVHVWNAGDAAGECSRSLGTRWLGRLSGRGGAPAKETPGSITASSVEHIALNSTLTLRSGFGMPSESVQIWDSSDQHSATTMTCITCCRS